MVRKMSEEIFEAERKEDILAKPVELVIGPSFVDSRLLIEGKNLPCTFLQVTVEVPEHTKVRATLHSLPRVDIEFYGKRVGNIGPNGERTDSLTGYLISEEEYAKFLEWKESPSFREQLESNINHAIGDKE